MDYGFVDTRYIYLQSIGMAPTIEERVGRLSLLEKAKKDLMESQSKS